MEIDAVRTLEAGRKLLAPVVESHGFTWEPGSSGSSSGGEFAQGSYVRGERKLELHYRHSLGLVAYHVGGVSVSHVDYLRGVLGENGANQYPGFSDEPLDAFRYLAHDLDRYCDAFLLGSKQAFAAIVRHAAATAKERRLP